MDGIGFTTHDELRILSAALDVASDDQSDDIGLYHPDDAAVIRDMKERVDRVLRSRFVAKQEQAENAIPTADTAPPPQAAG
jgi:stress response protein YsnF